MRISDIGMIIPLGLMVDSHVTPIDHQYYRPKVSNSERDRYEVQAPASGDIVLIQQRTQPVREPGPNVPASVDEYRVIIEHSCTFFTIYDLITSLSTRVRDLAGPLARSGQLPRRIPVAEGEVIGRIGGQTLDLGVVNTQVTLKGFVVPEHYQREPWKVHSVDAFPYFKEPLRRQLLALNPRTAEPRGGRIDYDVDGRLVGNWFLEGTNGYAGRDRTREWSGHLTVAYDHLDPTHIRVSHGNYDGRSTQFGVRGNGPDPAGVSAASGLVKYEITRYDYFIGSSATRWDRETLGLDIHARSLDTDVRGVMLVQLIADRRLRVEVFPGKRAAEVSSFTTAASVYER